MHRSNVVSLLAFAAMAYAGFLTSQATASPPPNRTANGNVSFYLSAGFINQSIHGDFDGISYFGGGSVLFIVPELSDGTGFMFSGGLRGSFVSFEIRFRRAIHDGNWSGYDFRTRYASVDLLLNCYPLARLRWPVEPYLGVSVTGNSLKIKNGYFHASQGAGIENVDAVLRGPGYGLQFGIEIYTSKVLSTGLEMYLNRPWIQRAEGQDDIQYNYDIDSNISARGTVITLFLRAALGHVDWSE